MESAGAPPPLPSGLPPNFASPVPYNDLLTFDGNCQFYLLPSGGEFNITQENGTTVWVPNQLVIYAVNCNLTDQEYINLWMKTEDRYSRVPFRSSLTPLMVVMTICLVACWITMGVIAALRRHPRPIIHKVALLYSCVLITVLYVHLHHFSRLEHMYGYESTDSFIQYFYGTNRAVAIFVTFAQFMICECHVLLNVFTNPKHNLWMIVACFLFFIFENSWWVAGVRDAHAYNVMKRSLNWKIRVYFYLEILAHTIYFCAYTYRVLSLWRFSFYRNNRALSIISWISTAVPFMAMLITAVAKGCFAWSLPLSMVTRALSLVLVWDWRNQTAHLKAKLEKEDALGRLITARHIKDEFKAHLGSDGDGHGALVSDSFATRVLEKLKHPKSLLSNISILGVGAHDNTSHESIPTETDNDTQPGPKQKRVQDKKGDDIIQHHPVSKHTVKVNTGGSVLRPRFDKSFSQNSVPRSRQRSSNAPLSRAGTFSTAHSSQAQQSNSDPSTNADTTLNSDTDAGPSGTNSIPTNNTSSAQPGPSSTSERAPSAASLPLPGPITSEPSRTEDRLPGFVPHPGFRSDDYQNEKRP